jgi:hypothetical protein
MQVTFAPACAAAPANRTATLTLTDNAPGSPQTIALSGTATGDFCIVPPAPASITPGATANFTLNVFSANNYSGQVTFASSGEPANSTYTFSPSAAASESVSVPAQITLSVVTAAATTSSVALGQDNQRRMRGLEIEVVIAICSLLFWFRGRDASRGKQRRGSLLGASVLVVVIVAGSCGGGATTTTDPPAAATTAGTYAITITGTAADGTTHTTNATLIVQ